MRATVRVGCDRTAGCPHPGLPSTAAARARAPAPARAHRRPMSRSAAARRPSVPRLAGPGELAAALPVLLGFVPQESLVLVCLQGRRVGLIARYDLPPPEHDGVLAADVEARVRAAGAERACLLVCTDATGPAPREPLVTLLRGLPLDLLDVVLVRAGRWRSYLCRDLACCPPHGAPLPEQAPALTLVRAEAAGQGRAVLPSRAALVDALRPPELPPGRLAELAAVQQALTDEVVSLRPAACRARLLAAFEDALRTGRGDVELALALADVLVRDEVLTWVLRREQPLYGLLLQLVRDTPAPYDAPVCACLAWVAYQRGDGATARVALERALTTDPQHGLALLLREALDAQVAPRQLRAVAARTARVLRRRR